MPRRRGRSTRRRGGRRALAQARATGACSASPASSPSRCSCEDAGTCGSRTRAPSGELDAAAPTFSVAVRRRRRPTATAGFRRSSRSAGALVQETLAGEGLAHRLRRRRPPPLLRPHPRGGGGGAARAARLLGGRRGPRRRAGGASARAIGRFAIFEGTVVSVGTRPATTYLDFGTAGRRT